MLVNLSGEILKQVQDDLVGKGKLKLKGSITFRIVKLGAFTQATYGYV
jgi:hypothetical protein